MTKHDNPTQKRRHILNKDTGEFIDVQSRAPYNFVSLPETMVEAKSPIPDCGLFSKDTFTGWIEFEIETDSPTYIRGMMSSVDYKSFGSKKADQLNEDEKKLRAPFYSSSNKLLEGFAEPVIPGSSLRGLIRSIVEIASYGRMRWVSTKPTFTFRAMAAEAHDPLKRPYQDFMGSNASNVRVGYLEKDNDHWYIHPAKTPKEHGVNIGRGDKYFVKVEDEDIDPKDVPGFVKMFSPDYKPQIHKVRFEHNANEKPKRAEVLKRAKKDTKKTRPSWIVKSDSNKELPLEATLVCSGNMKETNEASAETPRAKHYLVMPANHRLSRIPIPDQVVDDYRAGLTPYQKENLSAWASEDWGCLGDKKPVFYVADNPNQPMEILFFGHSPNFRIPGRIKALSRAATPLDFIPESIRLNPKPDMADAIFGWVEEENWGPEGQRAGRVFFEDAQYTSSSHGVWYSKEPVTPKILASPKVTTFQHYLAQDKSLHHDPDKRVELAHFGSPQSETKIRGHKFYWHKGSNPDIQADEKEIKKHPTQYTKMMPLNPGVLFKTKIRFENLLPEEIGALWWALTLPGDATNGYKHKLGMGKPLGMGAVSIKNTSLQLTKRLTNDANTGYYQKLFGDHTWYISPTLTDSSDFVKKFEEFILIEKKIAPEKQNLSQVNRIQELLEMLKWQGEKPDEDWVELTRYMEIEHTEKIKDKEVKYNEYKSRPVLPSPFGVWSRLESSQPEEEPRSSSRSKPNLSSQSSEKKESATGTVKWYRKGDYGYHGYIQPDNGTEDIHVDEKNIKNNQAGLKPGQKVRFNIWYNKKGKPCAENVEVVN